MTDSEHDIIPILSRYLSREATELEKQLLLRWLEEAEENRRFFSDFAANYSLHRTLSDPEFGRRIDDMSLRIGSRIDGERKRSRSIFGWLAIAASLVLIAGLALFLRPSEEPVEYLAVANTSSDVRAIRLDDGSQVWLRPGARIRYNVSGLADARRIVLEGQAYFDIARDEARPMTVQTADLGVLVLGTAFSVSSGIGRTQVVLERGSVRILSGTGSGLVSLTPGQKATFTKETGDVTVDAIYAEAYITQMYNLISLTDVTVPEILARLEAQFGVRIRSAATDSDKRYTLNYLKSDSLGDILSIVEYLTGAQCEILN